MRLLGVNSTSSQVAMDAPSLCCSSIVPGFNFQSWSTNTEHSTRSPTSVADFTVHSMSMSYPTFGLLSCSQTNESEATLCDCGTRRWAVVRLRGGQQRIG